MTRDFRTRCRRATRTAAVAVLATLISLSVVTLPATAQPVVPLAPGTPTAKPSASPDATESPAPGGREGSPFQGPVGGESLAELDKVIVDPGAAKEPPDVDVKSYVVADIDTGEILAAKNPHLRLPPASTLKTLTALTLLPRLDKRARYTAVRADADMEGSKVGLEADRIYTIDQLFYGLFLPSGNDAANALANASGGMDTALGLMMDEAARLGAYDTHVVNTSGLDEPGQVSSAYDLALFARAGLERPDFRKYASTLRYDFPGRNGKTFQIQNLNDLMTEYPGAIGVKNGYTTKAHHTLIGAAERQGRRLVVSLMRTDSPSWEKAADLLDWGYSVAGDITPVGTLVTAKDVTQAVEAQTAALTPTAGPNTAPAEAPAAGADGATGAPTVGAAPPVDTTVAVLPRALQRLPLWIWAAGALFIVLASMRVYGYVRSRRQSDARTRAVARG
ncbi:D-alanyl-D-alanine carboxypeptidase [Actinopolymorpha sp. B11F2]|uniref:D-alanyl-D-alanine carboxypeptidase family protein n=1 Tax=Actinopolymorpha sp. B11F2 TaxID=3160862 RepID=UPI0032E4CCAB